MEKCPRCNGTGSDWPGMTCGTCYGKTTIDEPVCRYCNHPLGSHMKMEPSGIYDCQCESSSGQFMCGCTLTKKTVKPVCNVCGNENGNNYCLNQHLRQNPGCQDGFEPQYYR